MAGYGGFHSYPRRYGGAQSRHQVITEALVAGYGDGVAASDTSSIQYAECYAEARAISIVWAQNERAANQMDPRRMTDMLGRWHTILGLPKVANASDADKRQAVLERFQRIAIAANRFHVTAFLQSKIPDVFVDVEYIPLAYARIITPSASWPFGIQAPNVTWSSTIASVLVRLQIPDGYTLGNLFDRIAKIAPWLDGVLPAWVKWTWYVGPTIGAPVVIPGGPSAAGFYLDEENLDREIFDT